MQKDAFTLHKFFLKMSIEVTFHCMAGVYLRLKYDHPVTLKRLVKDHNMQMAQEYEEGTSGNPYKFDFGNQDWIMPAEMVAQSSFEDLHYSRLAGGPDLPLESTMISKSVKVSHILTFLGPPNPRRFRLCTRQFHKKVQYCRHVDDLMMLRHQSRHPDVRRPERIALHEMPDIDNVITRNGKVPLEMAVAIRGEHTIDASCCSTRGLVSVVRIPVIRHVYHKDDLEKWMQAGYSRLRAPRTQREFQRKDVVELNKVLSKRDKRRYMSLYHEDIKQV